MRAWRSVAKLLTKDEARIAANIAKLPESGTKNSATALVAWECPCD
jgi:hypothetical protein